MADADHLVLAAPATAETAHLIDADVLERGEAGRAPREHRRGRRSSTRTRCAPRSTTGASRWRALDTVDPEPLPDGHWLYAHPKVRLSRAHLVVQRRDLQGAAIEIFLDNIGRFKRGEALREVVDPDEGY